MVFTYFFLSLIVISAYCALIIYILHQWYSIPSTIIEEDNQVINSSSYKKSITIVIPARNEAKNIQKCLRSIIDNNDFEIYQPEIIVVDDHSTDNTSALVEAIGQSSIKVIRLSNHIEAGTSINAYKKKAIQVAISKAANELILQLDADVILPPDFLNLLYGYLSEKPIQFVAGPVKMANCNKLIHHFQQLDILGMMGVTAAGIQSRKWHMANGANMLYNRIYATHDTQSMASGDDIYTIQAVAEKESDSIFFIKSKNYVVSTPPMDDYQSLYNQRIRWATKNKRMSNFWMLLMMTIPFINALLLVMHLVLGCIYGDFVWMIFLFHWLAKMGVDYIFLSEMTEYYDEKQSMKYFIPCNIIHVLYICFIGVMSLFVKNYTWKNRKVY